VTEGKTSARLKLLAWLCAFMFAALGTRLWFVQVLASADYQRQVQHNSVRTITLPAPRGRIMDMNGVLLAGNRRSLVVTVDRQHTAPNLLRELSALSKVTGVPLGDLRTRLQSNRYLPYTPVPVAFDVSKRVAFYLGENEDAFPGVDVADLQVRTYPDGTLAAHAVGSVGAINAEEIKDPRFANYDPNAIIGKTGVERTYETYLHGHLGQVRYQVNSAGHVLSSLTRKPAVAGDDVVLTIDSKVQRLAQSSLVLGQKAAHGAGFKAPAGAVVVMEPKTGQIRALASSPTFDPNVFVEGLTKKRYKQLFDDPKHAAPLFDRAVQAAYPPGSTFKPFVSLAALKEGYAGLTGSYSCPASYAFPGDTSGATFDNWNPVNSGFISLATALKISCDTVFYQFGADFYRAYRDTNQPNQVQNDLRAFGFGRTTGIDIPAENGGLIPTPHWKSTHFEPTTADPFAATWLPADNILMAIGQGSVAVTPLQLAVGYSAIANGGKVMRPHLVDRIDRPGGRVVKLLRPRVDQRLPFTRDQIDYVRTALMGVVQPGGTADTAFAGFPLSQIPVAAKTGTAQVPPFQDYSWFAAMAPAYDPKYVVVALVEQAGHGSETAAPVVRRILEGLFGLPLTNPATGSVAD